MSATQAFGHVLDAYIEATGSDPKEAKEVVAQKLGEAWARQAFGSGMAQRVEAGAAAKAAAKVVDGANNDE